jgi:hypothetical protein
MPMTAAPATIATATPAAVSPIASIMAVRTVTRPDGSGRKGRSRLSSARSKMSFQTIPERYSKPEASASTVTVSQKSGWRQPGKTAMPTHAARAMLANAVKTLGRRRS